MANFVGQFFKNLTSNHSYKRSIDLTAVLINERAPVL
jgi:hypothetical protein